MPIAVLVVILIAVALAVVVVVRRRRRELPAKTTPELERPIEPTPALASAPEPAAIPTADLAPTETPPLVAPPPEPAAPRPIQRFRPPPRPGVPAPTPTTEPPATPAVAIAPAPIEPAPVPLPVDKPRLDLDERRRRNRVAYKEGLAKTRGGFVARLARLLRGKTRIDAASREDIEAVLYGADIGSSAAGKLLARVTEVLDRDEVGDPDAVWSVVRDEARRLLDLPAVPSAAPEARPYVILMIGVNGVGKTTTLGKLAARLHGEGKKVLMVAGDTFRAAAVEQLEVWARRVGCEIHRGAERADPSAVLFEGIARGRELGADVVLCDTAGRLHTRKELMDELGKVRRAVVKALAQGLPPEARERVQGPHETLLVLDATIGQNALAQARMFKETTPFSGLVLTKLDGTAKGGVVLGVCDELGIPIRYVGVGEGIDDLRDFDPEDFTAALFDREGIPDAASVPPN